MCNLIVFFVVSVVRDNFIRCLNEISVSCARRVFMSDLILVKFFGWRSLGKCFILFVRLFVRFFCRCWAWFPVAVILWFIFNFRYQMMGLCSLLRVYVYSIELKKNRCRGLFKWKFLQCRTSISVNDLTARLQSAIYTVLCSQYYQITLLKINGLNMHAIVISRFKFREYATRKKRSRLEFVPFFPGFLYSWMDNIFPLNRCSYNSRLNIVFLSVFVLMMQTTHGHLYFIFMFKCDFNSIPWRNIDFISIRLSFAWDTVSNNLLR